MRTLQRLLPLACKAILFGFSLGYALSRDFSPTSTALFLLVSFVFYLVPLFHTMVNLWQFLFLLAVSVFAVTSPAAQGIELAVIIAVSVLFFLFIGVKNIAFNQRVVWFRLLHLGTFYLAAMLFFLSDKSQVPFLVLAAFCLASALLFFGFFRTLGVAPSARVRLIVWLMAFITGETAWALSLLPLHFVAGATALSVLVFFMEDGLLHYLKHTLTSRFMQAYVVAFTLLEIASFALAKWSV